MDGSTSPVKMDAIGRRSLRERAHESLKAALVNGHLPPASKLTETPVAQKMGVSPRPVREAFRRLAVANTALHSRICTDAVNSKLQTVLGLLRGMILRDRMLTSSNITRRREILAEHAGIVDALEAQDADRTEQVSQLHVRKGFA
jgi:DNA-binding GntR family transcriptional regulator